jgi:tetratricopeptide (TPR) repeat protein
MPSSAIAYNNRGVVYAKTGNYQKALADFEYALRINPYYADAVTNRALCASFKW